ncbi:MAG TPA: flagellar biosynthesis protein FlhF [Oscillatoriaceae cyanobacterium]
MKIRQYTAATMQEAILKIKVDLGPDAVILHTRKFKRGGVLGFFAQDMVEVLAAIDPKGGEKEGREEKKNDRDRGERDDWEREKAELAAEALAVVRQRAESRSNEPVELGPYATARVPEPKPEPRPELVYARQEPAPAPRVMEEAHVRPAAALETQPVAAPAAVALLEDNDKLAGEVQELKSTVSDLKGMLITIVGQLENQPRNPVQFPTLLQKVYDKLCERDVDPSIARGLVVYLQNEQPHLKSYELLVEALESPISGLIQTAGPLKPVPGEQKIVALVGPTGVGKTTTLAKMAANFTLAREASLAMLTIDTYRVAAIEQLKTYGDIIGLPVEVVLTPQGLKDALRTHQEKNMILIDTAGRSPYNRMHLNELKSFLDISPKRETHLVLSSTTRLADLKRIVRNFGNTGVDRLIFSKTDETDAVGGIISIAHETGLPVSYITTGQSVPDDIMIADSTEMARMLIQELKA